MWLNESYDKQVFKDFLTDFLPDDLELSEKELVIGGNYKEIKTGVILGECSSLDLKILQLEHEKERDPRVALANEAFKIMSENWAKKALVVFKSKNSDNWRLSFMTVSFDINEKNRVVTNLSNPKRKSFFLGPDAKTATPNKFLLKKGRIKDIEDLESCFDVEVVTKEFFDNYRKLFDKLNDYLKEDKAFNVFAGNNRIEIDDFAKKLLGQIVFIYFLQRKGWLGAKKEDHIYEGDPNFLRSQYSKCEAKDKNYFNDVLEYLFYSAFNKEPEKAGSFYREYFDCQIPFLNGGLFEPLNKYDWKREFLHIPNELFSNKEKTGILDVFDLYNFTIDENNPIDQEVSVDPEMLGKVFEKLLDTNKETGSFYTPREIVSYMVRQSLIEYLKTKTEAPEKEIERLINDHRTSEADLSKKDYRDIENALKVIKIIDPAVGSGAFPVGILQEMTEIRKICLDKTTVKPRLAYDIKREILENNIYGVDIDHGAIDIARLRFWLSLVVDADLTDVEPLPNLDFKLVAANTLLKLDGEAGFWDDTGLLDKMRELREKYFRAKTKNGKEKIQKSFKKLIDKNNNLLATERQKQIMTYNPFSPSSVAQFFDIGFMFGVKGFDLVIGNPPYVSHDKIANKEYFKNNYSTWEAFTDLYCFFIELGVGVLSDSGLLCFITSNSFLKSNYGLPTRKFIKNKTNVISLINIEDAQIFESAIVNTCIFILSKNSNTKREATIVNSTLDNKDISQFIKNNYFNCSQEYFNRGIWNLVKKEKIDLCDKIEKNSKTLEQLNTKIRLGIATGANNIFVINEEKKDELEKKDPKSSEIIKPVLRGRDINRYYYKHDKLYLLVTKNGIDVKNNYPAIYEYLNSFGDKFKNRGAKGQHWTNLRACSFFDDFKKDKIVWIELTDRGRFAQCINEIHLLNSAYFLLPPKDLSLKYLLGILNSSLVQFYLESNSQTSGMGTNRWINDLVKKFPIKKISFSLQNPIIKKVDRILEITLKENYNPKNTPAEQLELEKEIDEMVYRLYGLTGEEIKIVEECK